MAHEQSAVQTRLSKVLLGRGLVILGLSGLAVAQPLLELFGDNPEFFVAGDYSSGQIVWFAVIITLVPPMVGSAVVGLASLVNRRVGDVAFAVVVAVFAAALVLAIVRSLGIDAVILVAGLALLGSAGVAFLVVRTQGFRLLASYLAAANLAFAGMFVFMSPTSDLIAGGAEGDLGSIQVPELRAPVVVIVLDEFPVATIMRSDGTINAERYPAFAELASVSTWFRNASSQHNLTHRSVPSILDGRLGEDGTLPIYRDHPRNLFSLLGQDVPGFRYESVTDVCAPSICASGQRGQPLSQALADASIVYGHRVLPSALRDGLTPIDDSWGDFGADDTGGAGTATRSPSGDGSIADDRAFIKAAYSRWTGLGAQERSPLGQAGILRGQIDMITSDPAVHFVHVAVPHRPWVLSRTGISTSFLPELILDPDDPAYDFENRMEYQLHSMQVGAVDSLIGDLLDRLRSLPNWDDTLLVVTSDHGTNLTPPDLGRMKITDANREEAYRIPLFIKAPGQRDGEIDDASAQTIDVLPSIVDLLDADVDWAFDGHSLYDGSVASTPPLVSADVQAAIDIAVGRRRDFPHGDGWIDLAAVGDNGDLVGRHVDDLSAGEPSEFTVSFTQGALFDELPTESGEMPFALSGKVDGPVQPPEMLVALNGRLAGVIGGYSPSGAGWTFLGYVADLYQAGRNDVQVYEVERSGGAVTLHLAGDA
ncbi:hypothetical protein BH20ACT4_BH20ACT4_09600 [soil metagenome]